MPRATAGKPPAKRLPPRPPRSPRSPRSARSPRSVCTVVVNYNGLADTLDCLRSLRDVRTPGHHAVVVDNASRDPGEADRIGREHPEATVLRSAANLGFGGGCNLGIRWAAEHGYAHVFLLNNDARLAAPDVLDRLLDALEETPTAGLVGPKVVTESRGGPGDDGRDGRVWFAGGRLRRATGHVAHVGMGDPPERHRGRRPTDFVTGCALLARTDLLERLGGFDERYFLYYEEVDLAQRAARLGQGALMDLDAVVVHRVSSSVNRSGGVQYYYATKSRALFVRTWGSRLRGSIALCATAAASMALQLARGRPERIRLLARALRDARRGRWGAAALT